MNNGEYFLGLDIGTTSIGFAVTDSDYNVVSKGKKDFWGVRLFEEGKTAVERRVKRGSRRRLARRKERINLLQLLFANEVAKVDATFFKRLEESKYHLEDKSKNFGEYTLFNDKNYSDVDFYKKYPTIYHLRSALIKGKIQDIRMLYLGIAHILKNRGHFLFEGQDFHSVSNFKEVYQKSLLEYINDNDLDVSLELSDYTKAENILTDNNKTLRDREKELKSLLINKPTNQTENIIKLMLGSKVSLDKMFDEADFTDEELSKTSISFKAGIDEQYDILSSGLGDNFELIEILKAIYDWSLLSNILDGQLYLSDAKVTQYTEHKNDLKLLKNMVKQYIPEQYKNIFELPNIENNYPAYVGMTKQKGNKQVITVKSCTQEDFCKYIKNCIDNINVDVRYSNILKKIESNTLLPKLRTKDNSVIPYQIHQFELREILKVNAVHFSFLNNSDGEYTISEKIEKIFTYRIPYYVGPLNNHSKFAWIVKKSQEKITPWNFENIVDTGSSAEQFIIRMTNKCTYLKKCDVLPKNSLLYSKYMVLNELNNLKINGDIVDNNLKQMIYSELFFKNNKVTAKSLKLFLKKELCLGKDDELDLSGFDNDFKSSLKVHRDFRIIFGDEFDKSQDMIEDIIRWITLFPKDEKMLEHKISEIYPHVTKEQFKQIKSKSYSGWGRFSKELLCDLEGSNNNTGEVSNIINAMWNTNNNLMQLLSNDFTYLENIKRYNRTDEETKVDYNYIEGLYCSPSVKKAVWQAVQIVFEIEKAMGSKPAKLFIEVAREDGEKKRTVSRHKKLTELYNSIKNDSEYNYLIDELSKKGDSDLRIKKLYLYFTQLGRCAYTGEKIELLELFNRNVYDIDHIYPQSIIKDDSIHNNLVLSNKTYNSNVKSDKYPVPDKCRQPQLWKMLLDKELISKEKYNRLTRVEQFSSRELEGFINRSLVETRQSTKAVAEIFEEYYKNDNSKVVYVKAGNISDFRQYIQMYKVRELNDLHHAKDAYLAIVVGNIFDTKFTKNFFNNIKSEQYNLKPDKLYKWDIKSGDYYAWKVEDDYTKNNIVETLKSNKILFTRQARKTNGTLFDETIYKKGEGEFAVKNPVDMSKQEYKLTNLQKYGGHKSLKGAYFCVVEHEDKKGLVRSIEYIPIYLTSQIKSDVDIIRYLECKKDKSLKNVRVILSELKIDSLLNIDGFPMHLSGRTNVQIVFKGSVQLNVSFDDEMYIKKIGSFVNKLKVNKNLKIKNNNDDENNITEYMNLIMYDKFTDKLLNSIYSIRLKTQADTLIEKRDKFIELTLEEQCLILYNMLSFFKCNASKVDLKAIGGGGNVGTLLISKTISNCKTVYLINQSITGIYENKINLLE